MESNIVEIAIFSIAVTAIQWISRGTLREALVELATFYRHKDKDEKSILYSVLALTNRNEYHGEAPPQEEIIPEVNEEIEVDENVVIEKDEALNEQLGTLYQDVANLKTYLDDFSVQLSSETLKSNFISKDEFNHFQNSVKEYNSALRNDIDNSFKDLKNMLSASITFEEEEKEIVKEELGEEKLDEVVVEVVEETVEQIVKELEEIDEQMNIPVIENVEVVEEIVEHNFREGQEDNAEERIADENIDENSQILEASETEEKVEEDEILSFLDSLDIVEEVLDNEEVTQEIQEPVVEEVVEVVEEVKEEIVDEVVENVAAEEVIEEQVETVENVEPIETVENVEPVENIESENNEDNNI